MGQEVRLKDVVQVQGVRANDLIGFGLVIGLSGSGDSKKSLSTNKAVGAMLAKLGVVIEGDGAIGSAAAVVVTANLPAFARSGDRLDVKVSTIGDAKSLAGGTLIATPLSGLDGKVYAIAQGAVAVGQASGGAPQVLTVATVPQGATVEKETGANFVSDDGKIALNLKQSDFTVASRIVDTVNTHFKGIFANAQDPSSVSVVVPDRFKSRVVDFLSELENLKVDIDRKAVVVVNERTGTVVMGQDVRILPVAISHGELTIKVGDNKQQTGSSKEASSQRVVPMGGSSVGKLVETMNALGMKPADMVGVLQAIKSAGALPADLKFM